MKQININNICQHSVKCPSYIPFHKLSKFDWVETGFDSLFENFDW
jgi:hypothetical protein